MSKPIMMHCVYRPKPGKEAPLFEMVRKHWPVLHKAGLTTETPAQLFRAKDKGSNQEYFIEIFSWRDEKASGTAHQLPEVMAVWEPMSPLLVSGRGPDLAQLEPVSVDA